MTAEEQQVYPELAKIRDALWGTTGQAALMVGAGFSRQAEPVLPNAPLFPLWLNLQSQMEQELGLTPGIPRNVIDVAQSYDERFGRVALDQLILRHVPDDAYVPGENHRRLLGLNWADVFTTNYDTLLERAATDVFHRRYERIVSHQDIPLRSSPRIVKLHGSFPSHRPFVITRKDYEEYRTKSAPFVNLVQQSVMETVFVLLGFSGDDPNFQMWAGWVKDQLGEHAPPIYLCGVLDLTPDKRAALVSKRVTPIDLGPLFPSTRFPQRDARWAAAFKWLLEVWERGQPSEPLEWAPLYKSEIRPLDPPGPPVDRFTASPERMFAHDQKLTPDRMRVCVTTWRRQRDEYPGWIIAPERARDRIWESIRRLRSEAFKNVGQLESREQFRFLRELVWRLDLSLVSLETTETDIIIALLERWDIFSATLDIAGAQPAPNGEPWSDVHEEWIELAFAVLRTLREDFDERRYELWFARLDKLTVDRPKLIPRLVAERTYWELARLDMDALDTALEAWRHKDQTPWGRAKLAALYGEMGQSERAVEMATAALKEVRKRHAASHSKLELLSLEAWLVPLIEMLEGKWNERSHEVRDRVAQLRRLGCDPDQTREALQRELRDEEPKRHPIESKAFSFDPGRSRVTRRWNGGWGVQPDALVPAFSVLRLMEVAPHPLTTRRITWLKEEAAKASVWLEFAAPIWTLGFVVRTDRKESLERYMHRAHVALLPAERVEQYWRLLSQLVRQCLKRIPASTEEVHASTACHFGKVGLELLSRIAFRLQPDQLNELTEILRLWLRCASAAKARLFQDSIHNLSVRTVFALPENRLNLAALQLLDTPILEEKGFGAIPHPDWPEVSEALFERDDYQGTTPVSDALVSRLGHVFETSDATTSHRAADRCFFLEARGWLTEEQRHALARTIWKRTQKSGLPLHLGGLDDRRLLRLPGAQEHNAEALVRERAFKTPLPPLKKLGATGYETNILHQVCRWLSRVRVLAGCFFDTPRIMALTRSEALGIVSESNRWWHENAATLQAFLNERKWWIFNRADVHAVPEYFAALCGDVLLPGFPTDAEVVHQVEELLDAIGARGFDTARASVGLIAAGKLHEEEAAARISRTLLLEKRRDTSVGGYLVYSWSKAYGRGLIRERPPGSIVTLLAQRVALRAGADLDRAFYWLAALVQTWEKQFWTESRELLLHSLLAVAESTDLENWRQAFARAEAERHDSKTLIELRTGAAMLAGALYANAVKSGRKPEEPLQQWHKLATGDVLPEVRRAWTRIV